MSGEALKGGGSDPWKGGSFVGSSASGGDSAWAPADAAAALADAPAGERYASAGLVGRGGMGHVLIAYDRVLEREVALKIVRPDLATNAAADGRLANEARVTAALDHPGIVPVYDAGRTPDGAPFYVMRLVRGRSLADTIAERPALDARLDLLRPALAVCEAVAYAHHHGVVHRDVKPDNVMLGAFGEVQVMDWGLAEAAGATERHAVGTTAYMSPEQARGGVVDARSDVWSLGVLLLEIVAGRAPAPGQTRAALAEVAARGGADRVPAELIAIIGRCLAEDPAERYASHALVEDLARYLDGRRVSAYEYSLGALLGRAVRAWRVPLAVAGVALAVLVAVLVAGNARLAAERDRASHSLARVLSEQAASAFAAGALPEAERLAGQTLAIPLDDDPAGDAVRADARGALMARHGAPALIGRHALPRDCHIPRLAPTGEALVCVASERVSVWELPQEAGSRTWRLRWTASGPASDARALPALGAVVVSDHDGGLRRYDFATGEEDEAPVAWGASTLLSTVRHAVGWNSSRLHVHVFGGAAIEALERPCTERVQAVSVDRDERWIALGCTDGRFMLGRLGERPAVTIDPGGSHAPAAGGPTRLTFGAAPDDADVIAWGDARGRVGLARLGREGTWEPRWSRDVPAAVTGLLFDGVLYVTTEGGAVSVLSRDGDDLTSLPARVASRGLTRDRAGRLLAVSDDALTVWAAPASWQAHRLLVAHGGLTGATPSPDGARLAASTSDGAVVFSRRDGGRELVARPRSHLVKPVAWSADGGTVTGAWMDTAGVRVVDARTGGEREHVAAGPIRRVVALAGGLVLAVSFAHSTRVLRGREVVPVDGLGDAVYVDASASADGTVAVLVPELGASVTFLFAGERPRTDRVSTAAPAYAADVYDGGRAVVLARAAGVSVLERDTGRERGLAPVAARILDVAVSPDARRVAGSGDDGSVVIWALASGRLVARVRGHRERAVTVAFFPAGDLLASTSWDGTVRLWDMGALDASADAVARRVARWGEATTTP